jgi:hypothetical protein
MRKTVGTADRVVRIVVAVGSLIGSAVVGFATGWGIVLLVVAGILVVTGVSGYCPAYSVLGIDTRGSGASKGGQGPSRHLRRHAASGAA